MVDNLTYTIFHSTRLLVPESRIVLLHDVPHRNYGLGDRGGDCSVIRPPDRGDTLGDEPNRGDARGVKL